MSDSTVYELEIKVSGHGQPDAFVRREYVSSDKASTDGAAAEFWAGVSNDIKAKCRPVADQG